MSSPPALPADIQREIVAMASPKRVYTITVMEYTRVWYEVAAYSKEEAMERWTQGEAEEVDRNVKADNVEGIEEELKPQYDWDSDSDSDER